MSLRISRTLTDTPLAREHDLLMSGKRQFRAPGVPWSRFDSSLYPGDVRPVAARMWRDLSRGEYFSVETFSRISAAMALTGVPLDLVAAATRIAADEARHADLTLRMLALLSDDASVEVPQADLERRERFPRLRTLADLDLVVIDVPTFGETIATGLLLAVIDATTEPVARAVYRSLVADEVRHARFGWYYLAWRAPQWTAEDRQRAADHLGELLVDALVTYRHGWDVAPNQRATARALGVVDSGLRISAIERVIETELVPAYDALGLGASYAWERRRR